MKFILVLSLLWAGSAMAQSTVTLISTFAQLPALVPSSTRPQVRVLGGLAANDGLGYDVSWDAAASGATNTWQNGGPFAYPWGSSTGRWQALESTLWSTTLRSPVADMLLVTGDPNAYPSNAVATMSVVNQNMILAVAYTDAKSVEVVPNLAALLSLTVPTSSSRVSIVQNNTGGDGSAGQWLWDWDETAPESATCKKSNSVSPSDPGRWLKL